MFNDNVLVVSILFLKTYELLLYCTSENIDFQAINFMLWYLYSASFSWVS